jgi:hypothetical protein
MQPPPLTSSPSQLARYGRYVSRRLRRAKLPDLAAACDTVTLSVRDLGRAQEDAEAPVQDAIADRDAADDELDDIAKSARHKLAGRSLDAAKKAPYTQIFPNGIDYYTAATKETEVPRYTELRKRVADHLPASDGLRKDTLAKLDEAIPAYQAADAALADARLSEGAAGTRLDAAKTAWRSAMERTYGALVQQFGKAGAERFFPKKRAAKSNGKKKPAEPVG